MVGRPALAYGVCMVEARLENRATLRGRVASGFAWGVYISVLTQISRTIVAIVLVRLLTPDDYGLAAMALIFAMLAASFSDGSLGKALVQRPVIDELDKSTVFWATVAAGVLLSIAGFLAAGPIAGLFHEPRVQPLIAVLSLSFVVQSVQMTQAALLQREFVYRATAIRFTFAVILAGVVGVVAATLGAGAWSLVVQQMVFVTSSAVALWILSPWRPRFMFSWRRLSSLGGFGLNVMGTRLLNDVSINAGPMLIGRFLGSAALGAYSVAFNLITLPIARLVLPIQESLFPAYARIQEDQTRIGRIWLRTTTVVLAVMAPAMIGLAVVANEFVGVVLGSRWSAVAPLIALLAPVALAQALWALASTVLLGVGRSTTVFRWSLASTVLGVAACLYGLRWGTAGVAASLIVTSVPLAGAMLWSAARALDLRAGDLLRSLRGPFEASAAMAAAVVISRWLMTAYGVTAGIRLAALIVIGALVYIPTCVLRVAPVRAELTRLHRPRFRIGAAPGVSPAD
jgi:O-antigen/teichoic acid export membrane protein